ncbi:MAG: hypothetical protein AAB534_01405 [Patescibacteria group bacterium]
MVVPHILLLPTGVMDMVWWLLIGALAVFFGAFFWVIYDDDKDSEGVA